MRSESKITRISLAVAALCLCCALFACGCFLFYEGTDYGKFYIGYSKFERNAFVGRCDWDGDYGDMTFDVPDEYDGIKITELGGYIGRGYPCFFGITFDSDLWDKLDLDFTAGDNVWSDKKSDEEYETLLFTVRLGKNIEKLTNVEGKVYFGSGDRTEGDPADIRYKIAYFFEVDEENPVFYSKDGKLYARSGDSLIEEFFYE